MASFTDKRINRSFRRNEGKAGRSSTSGAIPPRGNQSRGPVFRDSADGEIASRRPRCSDYRRAIEERKNPRETFPRTNVSFLLICSRETGDSSKSRLRSNGNRVEERVIFLSSFDNRPDLIHLVRRRNSGRCLFIMGQFRIISNLSKV